METLTDRRQHFPLPLTLQGKSLVFRPLASACRDAMLRFARDLPEQDLLFLDRDIAQPPVVAQWIQRVCEGSLFTVVGWQGDEIVGYATVERGNVRWTRHVAELRVVVAESCRGIGLGRWLLELAFEMALEEGATKLVARMTPDQAGALRLFERLGFEHEAVLRDHAQDGNGLTHDLVVLSFHTRQHLDNRCGSCGASILVPLDLEGVPLCSHCYESRYEELGGGD
ncbi:MAG: GNAT family N-acetyltransferase [Candidatus Anammoximicrobium sp.]|nr:GNAT family N-acetyltransferase [Candidatus Anammoximicrobium sp.]